MPARDLAAELARTVAAIYGDAEQRLLKALSLQVAQDIKTEHVDLLAAYRTIQARTRNVLARLEQDASGTATKAVLEAWATGASTAVDELDRLGGTQRLGWLARRFRIVAALSRLLGFTRRREALQTAEVAELRAALPGIDAIMVLAGELTQRMSSTHLRVLRWQEDAYRAAVTNPAVSMLTGAKTRLQATQVMWDDLTAQGITGFVDKADRHWDLTSYAEMATRTATSHAQIEGHLDQLKRQGHVIAQVTDSPEECEICRPWEGKVLAIVGPAGPRQLEHAIEDGLMVTVDVDATLDEAILDGLFHPNCTHRLRAYLPGVTPTPQATENEQGYDDRQELRRLERKVRKAKRREAAALTPEARNKWARKVEDAQGEIRDHIEETGQFRRSDREQLAPDAPMRIEGPVRPPRPAPRPRPRPAPDPEPAPVAEPERPNLGDLTGRSDDDLFVLASEHADRPALLEEILGELDRRDEDNASAPDPLAEVDLAETSDADLYALASEHASRPDILERILGELEQRDAVDALAPVPVEVPDLGDLDAYTDDELLGLAGEHADTPEFLEQLLTELERRDDRAAAEAAEAQALANLDERTDDELLALAGDYADRPDILGRVLAELEQRDEVEEPKPVDLTERTDEELLTLAGEHAEEPELLERILGELERRDDQTPEPAESPGGVEAEVDEETPEQRRLTELVEAGRDWQEAYAEAYGLDVEDLEREARNAEIDAHRTRGETREETIRRTYREYIHLQWLDAENATRGHMVNAAGRAAGVDALSLFSGPTARARKYASEDLLRWWADRPRVTYAEWRAQLLGRDADIRAAQVTRLQSNGRDFI